MNVSNKYKSTIHHKDLLCGKGSPYGNNLANHKSEITCKVCIAKIKHDSGNEWPIELGGGKSNKKYILANSISTTVSDKS